MEQKYKWEYYDKYIENYIKSIRSKMIKLEPERKRLLTKFWFLLILYSIVNIICVFLIIKLFPFENWAPITKMLLSVFTVWIIPLEFNKIKDIYVEFKTLLKTRFMEQLVTTLGDIEYDGDYAHSIEYYEQLKGSNLFQHFDIVDVDDTFNGTYKNVHFDVAETRLSYISDKGLKIKSFNGIVIVIQSNKNVNTNIIITTKSDSTIKNYKDFDFLRKIFNIKKDNFQNVKFEDLSFDKKYKVQANDQIEARYFITPAFIERFKALKNSFKARHVKCAFYNNKIMFVIPSNKDWFEIGNLFIPLDKYKYINQFFNQITSIYAMIDHFKLNERTGL